MAQYDFGTIDPNTKSGTALASDLNSWRNAVHSTHSASTAPSYLVAGMLWADTTSANYELKMYDGAQWITVAILDATNNVARVAVDPAETSYITSTTSGQIRHLIASTDVFTVRSTGVQFNIASPVIADSNNNELISFTTVASAVNQLNIANGATGSGPTLSAVGSDTNQNIVIAPKGTGVVYALSETAATNTVIDVARIEARSTGTPAAGIGAGLLFAAETSASNFEIGARIEAITTDVTATSEDFDLSFKVMAGGAAATEVARLTSSGNLGLGVTPSAWGGTSKALQFSTGGIEARSSALSMNTNAFFNGTNWIYSTSANAALYNLTNTGQHQWYYAPSGTAGNAITFTQAMTLDASGNLLVGTTSAGGYRMNITGGRSGLTTSAGDSYVLYMRNPSYTNGCLIGNPGENMFAVSTASGAERLVIGASGQIGINGVNYGTSGQVLTSGGSGAAPSWANVDVGAATAGFTTASVGTFAFCNNQSGSTVGQNATVAGSSLRLSDSRDLSGSALAGTWRNMGNSIVTGAAATLFLRIS